jgi:N-methylhydantoinase B/oxoprolinase/acetone carboxylase alpha subunit
MSSSHPNGEPVRIGIDIGGTFTDVILIDASGTRWHAKVRSTPEDASQGVISGIQRVLDQAQVTPKAIEYLLHGTTVATNTVLQRQGATISLLVTGGFEDLLEIGRQQRPRLYDIFVKGSQPLIQRSQVVGVQERTLASGEIFQPLTEKEAQKTTRKATKQVEAVAVCLLFAYRNPQHEQLLKATLHEIAPDLPVSLSSHILPEFREYERLSTTVLNAYVTPVLARYLKRLEEALITIGINAPLLIMQNHGGVLQSQLARKHAVRLLFSGLAGGTLGGRYSSQVLKQDNIITFDMGGTSTDVALVTHGAIHETTEGAIDGLPCRVPMVDVNTVGAGGGSIAWIDEGQILRVGPKSAGAVPGPAAYGLGGQTATVTDANLILGRLNPDYFLGGDIMLNQTLALDAIQILADHIALPVNDCAHGIIRVVNANMERAIRIVSIQRGHDPREFALAAFGGAGPMHAWALAVNLGIPRVIVPYAPGLHSALGLLTTDLRIDQSQTVLESTDTPNIQRLLKVYSDLETQLVETMREQGVTQTGVQISYSADLRYQGQAYEIPLPVPRIQKSKDWVQDLELRFHSQHELTYGYAAASSPVTIVNLRVGAAHAMPALNPVRPEHSGGSANRSKPSFGGGSVKTDPITFEVLRNAFISVAEEMGAALVRTAYSPNIKERRDCSAAIFDSRGQMVSQAEHIPVHLGAMPESINAAIDQFPFKHWHEGDMVILNDPFAGGTHLPDITLIAPVILADDLVGFVANRAHHADVGGSVPGSMPGAATEIFQEGLRIPPTRLVKQGEISKDLWQLLLTNVRTPFEREGDLRAQLAANVTGVTRFSKIIQKYSKSVVEIFLTDFHEYSRRRMLKQINEMPNGEFTFTDYLDNDGIINEPVPLTVKVIVQSNNIAFDFSESSPQTQGNVNAPFAVTLSCSYYVLRCITDPSIPVNAGCYSPLKVTAPLGSVLNPRPPAAVSAGNVETSQRIVDVLFGALHPALPDRIPAASQGTMNNLTIGGPIPDSSKLFTFYETIGGGLGARPTANGLNGVHSHMTNTANTPIEALETSYPLRVLRYHLIPNSGGAGKFQGGKGIRRDIEILSDHTVVSIQSERRQFAPWGLEGGSAGKPGKNYLGRQGKWKSLPGKVTLSVEKGDIIRIHTPGGGGYGISEK